MRRSLLVLAMAGAFVAGPLTAQTPQRDLDNTAASRGCIASLRYFYPSDAAASLACFAVHGVRQTRSARASEQLESVLKALFSPLGPGIDIGRTLSAFRHRKAAVRVGRSNRQRAAKAWRSRQCGFARPIALPR
jgi:hypothetical protein